MRLEDLSDEDLHAEWRGRNEVLRIVTTHPDRYDVPALVVESLIEWAKEPEVVSDARIARLQAAVRGLSCTDPALDDLRAELTGAGA